MTFKDVLRSVSSNTSMIIPRSWQTWTSIFTLGGNLWEWISSNKIKYTKNCNIKIPIPTQKGLLLTIEAAMKENVSRGRRGGSFTSSYLRSSFSSSKISPSFKDQGKLMEWWVSRRVCPDQPLPLDVKNVLVRTLSSSVLMIEVRQCRGVFDDLRYCWVIDSSRGAVTYSRADTFIPVPMIEGLLYEGRHIRWLEILLVMRGFRAARRMFLTFHSIIKSSLLKLLCTLARLCEGTPLQPVRLDFLSHPR